MFVCVCRVLANTPKLNDEAQTSSSYFYRWWTNYAAYDRFVVVWVTGDGLMSHMHKHNHFVIIYIPTENIPKYIDNWLFTMLLEIVAANLSHNSIWFVVVVNMCILMNLIRVSGTWRIRIYFYWYECWLLTLTIYYILIYRSSMRQCAILQASTMMELLKWLIDDRRLCRCLLSTSPKIFNFLRFPKDE